MPMSRHFVLVLLLFSLTRQAEAAPPTGPDAWCGTHPASLVIAEARHDSQQRYLARERQAGRMLDRLPPMIRQEGQIAILEDDGTVTRPVNNFDLAGRSIQYLRRPRGMSSVRSNLGFKQLIGDRITLRDDDSAEVPFPAGFRFPFGDQVYTSVFVNSNGNLSFGQPNFFLGGLDGLFFGIPTVAPLFTDLNPAAASGENGVYVSFPPGRVRITWQGVPEFGTQNSNTFQVTLFSTGKINFAFGDVDAVDPVVGVAPFQNFNLHLLDYDEELPLSPRRAVIAEQFTNAPLIDEIGAVRAFTENFEDVYTTVFLWLDFPAVVPGFAFEFTLKNDVRGIGQNVFDITNLLFPASRNLESFVEMGDLSRFPDDPDQIFMGTASTMVILGHEFGHRWLTRVRFLDSNNAVSHDLRGSQFSAHWGYHTSSEGSLMHGNAWADNGNGSFSATNGAHSRYSPLDRYLMGLASAASVPDLFYIANPDDGVNPGNLPVFTGSVNGQRVDVSIDDIIAAEGPRRPSRAASPNTFRTAFLLVSLVGQDASPASIAKLDRYRARWTDYFREATGNRGEVKTGLFPR